jgi:hypothetical protein
MENIENEINNTKEIQTSIKWWETKRLLYNLVTLAGGLLVLLIRSGVPNGIGTYNPVGDLLFWLFVSNIFYTCGWGLEILLNYYLKIRFFKNAIRTVLFTIGCIFSFCLMFIMTRELP